MLSADGGGGVPPFFSLLLCPSILYHHSRFVSIRSGRTFTTSRESPSSRRHAHVAVRLDTAVRVRILRRNFDSTAFLGCLQALASSDLSVCQRSYSASTRLEPGVVMAWVELCALDAV
jgi:hypothetical protein